ncbi:MAG: hypothetical protein HZB39_16975 [Planctomycetes bacterium]|nr:hypothetical protein [Planctomycetota bacterium]
MSLHIALREADEWILTDRNVARHSRRRVTTKDLVPTPRDTESVGRGCVGSLVGLGLRIWRREDAALTSDSLAH